MRDEEIEHLAEALAEHIREYMDPRDVIIGVTMGEGAMPLHGREKRQEPCLACRIDPAKPLEAGNVMATTKGAIGTLSQDEVRGWCSEIVEVMDGRCERARRLRIAAQNCKELHPDDARAYFECFIPEFSRVTR